MRRVATLILVLIGLLALASAGWGADQDQGLNAIGIREGWMATPRHQFFHQYEAYVTWGLPWSVRGEAGWGEGWGVALQANAAAGALHSDGVTGFICALGPGFIIDKAGGKGIALEIGGDLNILSRDEFGGINLNGNALFDGHVGLMYRFAQGPGIGYRFQHMSNAGLNGNINTGLDLHMLSLSWNF